MHRIDLCTLTAETAWTKYKELSKTNRLAAIVVLKKHFERVDERAIFKGFAAFHQRNDLDHTAKGKQ